MHVSTHEITLIEPTLSFEKEHQHLYADVMHIDYGFHLISRILDLDITMDHARIDLTKGFDLELLLDRLTTFSSWITVHGKLRNEHGLITLDTAKGLRQLEFVSAHHWGNASHSYCRIEGKLEDESQESAINCLEMAYDEKKGLFYASHVEVDVLTDLVHALFPKLQAWCFKRRAKWLSFF